MIKKRTFVALLSVFYLHSFAQAPYIATGTNQGLGQYGYINKNAVTFISLDRNTYSNVNSLAARWYVNGSDVLYNVSGGPGWAGCNNWQCSGCNSLNLPTANFNPADFGANWIAGNDAYVSVYAYYCGGAFSNSSGTTGFNERKFTIVDLNTTTPSPSLGTSIPGGGCNSKVVGTFILDVGSAAGLSLTRFVTQNSGTATEATLGNAAFKLYYETATGLEVFDGNESNSQLFGDFGGDATNNNIFGSTSLSISLSGKTRFYLVACDNPILTQTVDMSIINDGISLAPNNNTSYGMLRINSTSLGGSLILPVGIISFNTSATGKKINLNWTIADGSKTNYFEIERSLNGINFESIGRVNMTGTVTGYSFDDIQPISGVTYYRLKIVESNGSVLYSAIANVKINNNLSVSIMPNPASSFIVVNGSKKDDMVIIMSISGSVKIQRQISIDNEKINVQGLQQGNYYVRVVRKENVMIERFTVLR